MLGLPPLSLLPPSAPALAAWQRDHDGRPWSYDDVGATRERRAPPGYTFDEEQVDLGAGAFPAAAAAVRRWAMFDPPWLRLTDRSPPSPDRTVVFASRQLGMWALSACRVVYVVDEPDVYGFAYGTLDDHAVSGEEQFLVERGEGDRATFAIRKFSRITSPALRAMAPYVRGLQLAFSRDACAAVAAEVGR